MPIGLRTAVHYASVAFVLPSFHILNPLFNASEVGQQS